MESINGTFYLFILILKIILWFRKWFNYLNRQRGILNIVIGSSFNFMSPCQLFVWTIHMPISRHHRRVSGHLFYRTLHCRHQRFYILVPQNLGANISRLPTIQHCNIVIFILAYLATVPYFTFSFLFFPPTVDRPGVVNSIYEM